MSDACWQARDKATDKIVLAGACGTREEFVAKLAEIYGDDWAYGGRFIVEPISRALFDARIANGWTLEDTRPQ